MKLKFLFIVPLLAMAVQVFSQASTTSIYADLKDRAVEDNVILSVQDKRIHNETLGVITPPNAHLSPSVIRKLMESLPMRLIATTPSDETAQLEIRAVDFDGHSQEALLAEMQKQYNTPGFEVPGERLTLGGDRNLVTAQNSIITTDRGAISVVAPLEAKAELFEKLYNITQSNLDHLGGQFSPVTVMNNQTGQVKNIPANFILPKSQQLQQSPLPQSRAEPMQWPGK